MIISQLRVVAIIAAVSTCAIAIVLWLNDGAWQNGSMPTKGVVRTFLFAASGCAALLLASIIEKRSTSDIAATKKNR